PSRSTISSPTSRRCDEIGEVTRVFETENTMRYRSQAVAYWYFAVAMVLFGLQLVFGLLSAAKYLGPDPLLYILPFDVTKVIHTNLLIVWVLTGFMVADRKSTRLNSIH